MKILILSYYNPWISGGGHRPVCFLEQDLKRDDEIFFVFFSKLECENMKKYSLYYKKNLKLILYRDNKDFVAMNFQSDEIINENYIINKWKPDYVRAHNPVESYISLIKKCRSKDIPFVYDQMDYWDDFPVKPWGDVEKTYMELSTKCITISNWLKEYNKQKSKKDFNVVPNGIKKSFVDVLYADEQSILEKNNNQRKTVLYMGAMWPEWYDWDLTIQLVSTYCDYKFIFVGSYLPNSDENDGRDLSGIVEQLKKYPNVTFVGQVEHQKLIQYLKCADIGIIPFIVNKITQACSPLKCFEYIAAYLPVVTTALPEIKEYPLVYYSNNKEEFIKNIEKAIDFKYTSESYKRVNLFNSENTWEKKILKLYEKE